MSAQGAQAGALLEVDSLGKSYGAVAALKSATFSVEAGEAFAIIGPNGAGKTTLFKALTGEVMPDRGSVRFRGADVTRTPAHRRAASGFGRTFQVARVFPNTTALENVIVAIEARQRTRGESPARWYSVRPARSVVAEAEQALARIGLAALADTEARYLSHGDKKRLELALTLALQPGILMLDEPTAGMSPSDRQQTVELLARIRRDSGVTLLLTEHDMDVVFGLAGRIMVLNYGEQVALGTPQEIRADRRVQELYLGEEVGDA
jgi:branched-chain amino acid transport system ATP-binding protein